MGAVVFNCRVARNDHPALILWPHTIILSSVYFVDLWVRIKRFICSTLRLLLLWGYMWLLQTHIILLVGTRASLWCGESRIPSIHPPIYWTGRLERVELIGFLRWFTERFNHIESQMMIRLFHSCGIFFEKQIYSCPLTWCWEKLEFQIKTWST